MKRAVAAAVLVVLACSVGDAAERLWQRGTWVEVKITRPKIVIGVRPRPTPGQTPKMTEIKTYVIATDDLWLEMKEPTPPPLRSIEVVVGDPVAFAVDKKTIYIRDEDGAEHRLQLTKKEERRRR